MFRLRADLSALCFDETVWTRTFETSSDSG